MSKVILKYSFIFDPSETWHRQDDFETSLGQLLKSVGLVAEIVNTNEEYPTEKILLISRVPDSMPDEQTKENSARKQKQDVMQKVRDKGRFVSG